MELNKKTHGQFYTTKSKYILDDLFLPSSIEKKYIIEPFAGQGDLIDWIKEKENNYELNAFDIEPKRDDIKQLDTLKFPPNYKNTWVITNPPYLARNKSENKEIFKIYNTNDLYKCFINSICNDNNFCKGGILIIPAGFFFSHRDIDIRCRNNFMKNYKITKIKYFEEQVFTDTKITIVAFSFEKSQDELKEQNINWIMMPSKISKNFNMSYENSWIIGGNIYTLPIPENINIRRHVDGVKLKNGEQQTFITLNAIDNGKKNGRISLKYIKDYIYPSKECSRSYATFRIIGKELTEQEQIELCEKFNEFIEKKREESWSLFLPQFRESKEYARKRIPFELAYRIFLHIIYCKMNKIN